MQGLVIKIYDYFRLNRPVFWVVFILSFLIPGMLAMRISFGEDISKMLQADAKTQEYNKLVQNTSLLGKLILCVSDGDQRDSSSAVKMAFCDSLMVRLNSLDSTLVKKVVSGPADFPFTDVYHVLVSNLPFFLEEKDYTRIDSLLQPARIKERLRQDTRLLSSPAGMLISQRMAFDPAGISDPVTLRLKELGESSGYVTENGYFFTADKRNLIILLQPANPVNETRKNKVLITKIEDYASELQQQAAFRSLRFGMMGGPAVSVGNASQIQRDTAITLSVMVVALVLLITSVFRKKRTPLLIFLPVVFGMLFALACISFISKEISLIAIGASSLLLGIAVNYPLHILTHRLHEKDLRTVIAGMVEPMTIGSATTIGGFVCLFFVRAEILHDFGLLGAFGLIGAVIFSLIFLPHLVGTPETKQGMVGRWLEKAGHFPIESGKWLRWTIILLTPLMFWFSNFITFDSDLMHLNYMSPRLKQTEALLQGRDSLSRKVYVISFGDTPDQALEAAGRIRQLADSLKHAGINLGYTGISDFLPSEKEQQRRMQLWKAYFTPAKIAEVKSALREAGNGLGFRDEAFNPFLAMLAPETNHMDSAGFALLREVIGKESISENAAMATVVSVLKVPKTSFPLAEKVLSEQEGSRLMNNKALSQQLSAVINADFNFIALVSALLVFFALLLTYGRIELALTAFIPMVVSWIWILGLMGLFGIEFNIVNIILSTFIFGLGDDYCIFTMDGLLQEYRNKTRQIPVIRMSIVLSGLTTLIGFGVMLLAKHPALKSLALVSVIGISSVLLISQVLIPYLFHLFITSRARKGFPPMSLGMLLKSVFAFGFFILGCIVLSIAGFFLVVINPLFRKTGRRIFNFMVSKTTWAQLYVMINLKKRILRDEKTDFSKPAILVANHQSVIDILAMIMLNPRIILMTNHWVWNSPLFGYIVRMAGYYPIMEGAEPGIDALRERIRDGYSIAVFPEGTRSKDGTIGRFHKGAFYLAEQLSLDIIPVVLHGTGDCITKGSFSVNDTTITVRILPRIAFGDPAFGQGYQQRTKAVQQLIRRQYEALVTESRNPRRQKQRLMSNFLFKGPVLEWYMRVKMRLEDNYTVFHNLVPLQGKIVDAGCGYGFMAYMLAYLSPARQIRAFDYDHEKIGVADHAYGKPANLSFETARLQDFDYSGADCILISDVLHYLKREERNRIFETCAEKLSPGGLLIIRDGDKKPGRQHSSTRFTEFLSTRLFNFNQTRNKLEFFSFDELTALGAGLGLESEIVSQAKLTSNRIIVFRKNEHGREI
jgi:uncharacterized protein